MLEYEGSIVTNLEEAKTTCGNNPDCKMFYDVDSQHKSYSFCNSASIADDSSVLSSLFVKCALTKILTVYLIPLIFHILFKTMLERSHRDIAFFNFLIKITLHNTLGTSDIIGGPSSGSECLFPFEYKDKMHYQCIIEDSPHQQPWCSSTPKFSKSTFGYCDCAVTGNWVITRRNKCRIFYSTIKLISDIL